MKKYNKPVMDIMPIGTIDLPFFSDEHELGSDIFGEEDEENN
jgi:hypothetical protein